MYKSILNILVCPICKNKFDKIEIIKDDEISIIDGKLYCYNCNKIYLIEDSIPNLLSMDVVSLFKKNYTPLKEPLDIYRK